MGRRHGGWPERPARPEVRKLDVQETQTVVEELTAAIQASPVLTALRYRLQARRDRFYYESDPDGTDDFFVVARVTPLVKEIGDFLLEVEQGSGSWSEVFKGAVRGIGKCLSGDNEGTFHGLGRLDASIRKVVKANLSSLVVEQRKPLAYYAVVTGSRLSVPEVLFYIFEVPIPVIAQPRGWYQCHRKASLSEVDEVERRILVAFTAESGSGESFGGRCLYCQHAGKWHAFRIKPNQSASIASSLAWLEQRAWKPW